MIRIQAESAGSEATYGILARSRAADDPQLLNQLAIVCLGSWIRVLEDTFQFKKTEDSDWDHIDQGLEAIRQRTSRSPEALVAALDAAVEPGTHETFDGIRQGYWDTLEYLVSRRLDEITTATAKCCAASARVRLMANLLRAEKNQPYDRTALAWAKSQNNIPNALSDRLAKQDARQ